MPPLDLSVAAVTDPTSMDVDKPDIPAPSESDTNTVKVKEEEGEETLASDTTIKTEVKAEGEATQPGAPPEEEFPIPDVPDDGVVVELNNDIAVELMKQAVASTSVVVCLTFLASRPLFVSVELSLYGFESASSQALNVLTAVMGSFIERVGFLCRSFLDVPGTTSEIYVRRAPSMSLFFINSFFRT